MKHTLTGLAALLVALGLLASCGHSSSDGAGSMGSDGGNLDGTTSSDSSGSSRGADSGRLAKPPPAGPAFARTAHTARVWTG